MLIELTKEGGFIENATISLYFAVAILTIIRAKNIMNFRQLALINIVIFCFIQREMSLFRSIGSDIFGLALYKQYNDWIYVFIAVVILFLLFKDRAIYLKLLKEHNRYLTAFFVVILTISQLPDLLNSKNHLFIFMEEFLEMFLPVIMFFVIENIRKTQQKLKINP
jgi:hypothetical protein